MLIHMKSLDKGPTQVRTVRIPQPLWDKLTEWAARSGVGDSEALRRLLALGIEGSHPVHSREQLPWMNPDYAYARVPKGDDWWDLDDLVGCLPGVRRYEPQSGRFSEVWWQVPRDQVAHLESLFHARPERLELYP